MEKINSLLQNNTKVSFKCEVAGGDDGQFIVSTTSTLHPKASATDLDIIKNRLKK